MVDLFDEGFGAGECGCSWPQTAGGRFFKEWERKVLAAGWHAGRGQRAALLADAEAACERAAERMRGRELVEVADSEYPW